jgi:hypothetical protein
MGESNIGQFVKIIGDCPRVFDANRFYKITLMEPGWRGARIWLSDSETGCHVGKLELDDARAFNLPFAYYSRRPSHIVVPAVRWQYVERGPKVGDHVLSCASHVRPHRINPHQIVTVVAIGENGWLMVGDEALRGYSGNVRLDHAFVVERATYDKLVPTDSGAFIGRVGMYQLNPRYNSIALVVREGTTVGERGRELSLLMARDATTTRLVTAPAADLEVELTEREEDNYAGLISQFSDLGDLLKAAHDQKLEYAQNGKQPSITTKCLWDAADKQWQRTVAANHHAE